MISSALSRSSRVVVSSRIVEVFRLFIATLLCAAMAFGQSTGAGAPETHGVAYSGAIPYEGSVADALAAAAAGTTIPMASYSFTATKDGLTYTDVIVGSSPFATKKPTTKINVLIIPVIVEIEIG